MDFVILFVILFLFLFFGILTLLSPIDCCFVGYFCRMMHCCRCFVYGCERCIACRLCDLICPSLAIECRVCLCLLQGWRFAILFDITYRRCIYCGFCNHCCPTDAITHLGLFLGVIFVCCCFIYPKYMLFCFAIFFLDYVC